MSQIEAYMQKIDAILKEGGTSETQKADLVKDITSVFCARIPTIKDGLDRYRGRGYVPGSTITYDNDGDLRKLYAKLSLLREEEERDEVSDPLLCSTKKVRYDIERCRSALADGDSVTCGKLAEKLVRIYEADVPGIGNSLTIFEATGGNPDDRLDDLEIVQGRLEHYRDKVASEAARLQGPLQQVSVRAQSGSSAISEAFVNATLAQTSQQVQLLPDETLSAGDKVSLCQMLGDLERIRGKSKEEAHPKYKAVLAWLADKGIDVAIAVLPYIVSWLSTLA